MPGMHFIHSPHSIAAEEYIRRIAGSLLHDDRYAAEVLFDGSNTFLGATRYPDYPVTVIENDSCRFFFEGILYNRDKEGLRESLIRLSGLLSPQEKQQSGQDIAKWLAEQDGDFVLFIRHKASGAWFFLNDALGRLPVYASRNNDRFIISREIKLFTRLGDAPSLDRPAAAEHLLFGFPVGGKTLLERVKRLPAASFITVTPAGDIDHKIIHELTFDPPDNRRSFDDYIGESVDLFTTACRRRARPPGKTIVSLSGGLDSRSVAAGLLRANCPFTAITHQDASGKTESDVAVAERVAGELGLDWRLFQTAPPTGRDVARLLSMKVGMNPLIMATALPFLRETIELFGSDIVYLTGDGGDKALPDLYPARKLPDADRLRRYILNRHDLFSIDDVSALTGLSRHDIHDHLVSVLDRYPETTMEGRYIHFMIYERGMAWLFEGEDRSRCFAWSGTPFYSLPFFRHAMAVPFAYKKYHRFYREFLNRLSPQAAAIEDNNLNTPLLSPAYRRKKMVFSFMERYPRFFRTVKRISRRQSSYSHDSPMIQCMQYQSRHCESITEFFDSSRLKRLLENPDSVYGTAMENLFTLTSLIEDLHGDGQSLKNMADTSFV